MLQIPLRSEICLSSKNTFSRIKISIKMLPTPREARVTIDIIGRVIMLFRGIMAEAPTSLRPIAL
jgi:hypothetical protein